MSEEKIRCMGCMNEVNEENIEEISIYSSAYDEDPKVFKVCEDCIEMYDEDTFDCEQCGRKIDMYYGQNSNYRTINCSFICISCLYKELLEKGTNYEYFEDNQLFGLFFNDSDLEEKGFKKVESKFIRDNKDAIQYNNKLIELAKTKKVIIEYSMLSILGNEGHINLWIKE